MDLIEADDPRYDQARAVFNAMFDKRPAVIAACATPSDVADALDHARQRHYDVAVRAGGHSVAGASLNDGGLVVDVRPMKTIDVDAAGRRARVGAGVTWGEFDRATQAHGLAATGGRASTTGVAGLTLGGGSGWLERSCGLACDNLLSVDLVTADGREVSASETDNPDLFWALHGGGGNFGVATTFEFRLHPVGPEVLAGLLIWPGNAAYEVAQLYRDVAYDAPVELGSGLILVTGPAEDFVPQHMQGATVALLAVLWAGEIADGQEAIKAFRDLRPEVDLVAPMPYAEFQCMIDDPPGLYSYATADYHDDLGDEALEVFVEYGFERKAPNSQQIMLPWGRSGRLGGRRRHPDGQPGQSLGHPPLRPVGRPRRHRSQHRLGQRVPTGYRAVHKRGRVPQLHRQRRPRPDPRRLRRREVPPPRQYQSRMGPKQHLPKQPEHRSAPRLTRHRHEAHLTPRCRSGQLRSGARRIIRSPTPMPTPNQSPPSQRVKRLNRDLPLDGRDITGMAVQPGPNPLKKNTRLLSPTSQLIPVQGDPTCAEH
jgi:hypothetical protein